MTFTILATWVVCSFVSSFAILAIYSEDHLAYLKPYAPAFFVFAPVFAVLALVVLFVRGSYQFVNAARAITWLCAGPRFPGARLKEK